MLRVAVGSVFAVSGAGKFVQGLPNVVRSFAALGIPFPDVAAPVVGLLELGGGVALLLGAGTRVFASLFVAEMIVAIVVARLPAPGTSVINALIGLRLEFLLAIASVCLVVAGGGPRSIDALVAAAWPDRRSPRRDVA